MDFQDEEEARSFEMAAADEEAKFRASEDAAAQADIAAEEQENHDLEQLLHEKAVAIVNIAPDKDNVAVKLYEEGNTLLAMAEQRIIKSDADVKLATDDLAVIKGLVKKLEELKKKYEAPFKAHLVDFRAVFDKFMAPLVTAECINKEKWGNYRRHVEEAARKAEETNRMAEEVARRQAEVSGTGEITVDTTPVEVPKTANTIRANIGTGSAYKTPKYEVTDFKALPDEYKLPDAAKLTKVIKAAKGEITIPGVRIWLEDVLAVRAK